MKTFSKIFAYAAVAAFALSSCTSEKLKNDELNSGKTVTVHFGAETTDPSSKATLNPDGENAFLAAWEKDDKISVYYINDNIVNEDFQNGIINASWNGSFFTTSLPEYNGRWEYSAAYPVPDENDNVDFGPNRTQKGNVYNSKYDIMIGSAVAKKADAGKDDKRNNIVFKMDRQTAIAYFHFTSDLNETVTSATLKVTGGAIANSATSIQLTEIDKFIVPEEKNLTEITLTFEDGTAPSAKDFQLWFNVLPTSYTSMTLTVETASKTFTISKDTKGKLAMYEAGKLYKVKKSGIAWTDKPAPEPVVLYSSDVTTSGYVTSATHIINTSLPFEYLQIMANGNNQPTGYGAGQIMQFKKDLGAIYNTESFGSPVKYVEVYAQSSNPFCVYYGDSKAPSENKISRPTTPNGSKTISIEDNNGKKNVEEEVNYYLLNLSSYNANYIRIVNGSSTNYFYKIVLLFDEPETVQVTGITLDKTEVTINEGETTTLTATIAPADATIKDVNWTSDNESVATVTDGVVSGLSVGTATITATTVDGEFTASCVVTVNELSKISTIAEIKDILKDGTSSSTKAFDARLTKAVVTYVNGSNAFIEDESAAIVYYKSGHGLKAGDVLSGDFAGSGYSYNGIVEITSVTTTPTIKEDNAPAPTVATLAQISENFDAYDSRWVKLENVTTGVALKSGTRTSSVSQNGSTLQMYAKVQDTELAAESFGDMICIPCYNKTNKQIGFWEAAHFTAKNVAVTGVTLDKSEVSITVGKTATLNATVTPTNATNKNVSWTSSAEDVATVANGVVTAVKAGEATITVTTEDGKYTADCVVTVTAATAGVTYSYKFTSKSWEATLNETAANWTSGKDGNSYVNSGVQVTTGVSGANATSPIAFTNVSNIVVRYCTNAKAGKGTVTLKVGETTFGTQSISAPSSGGTTEKSFEISTNTPLSGNVNINVTCTTNSIYIIGIDITAK